MSSTDQSNTSGDDEHAAISAMQHKISSKVNADGSLPLRSVHLASFRAACQQRAVAHKVRESEARARALAVGSATEELKREQRKRREAVQRAKQCEEELAEAQNLAKQLQYINSKLQQQLLSTQAAAKIAADRSHSSVRNLRETLCTLETDTSHKFAQGQQQVQRLISFTKRLQSCLISSSNTSISSCSKQHLTSTTGTSSSCQATQAISGVFQALAALGELLVPTAAVLLDTDGSPSSTAPSKTILTPVAQQLLTSTQITPLSVIGPFDTNSSRDASCLAAQLAVQQARLEDITAEKAALQRQCDSLQRQCDELHQQLRRQAGSCAELSHDSQLTNVQHLAEVAGLQAEKLQLQQEVDALQQSLTSAQTALQLLRQQHEQQTSRLANTNAEVLQLRDQVSQLQLQQMQQQQDATAALCIVAGRDAHTADATLSVGRNSPRQGRNSPRHNLLSSLTRPCSLATAAGPLSPISGRVWGVSCNEHESSHMEVQQMAACTASQQQSDQSRGLHAWSDTAVGWIAAPRNAPAAAGQLHCQLRSPNSQTQGMAGSQPLTTLGPVSGRTDDYNPVPDASALEGYAAGQLHNHQLLNCSISPGASWTAVSPGAGSQQQHMVMGPRSKSLVQEIAEPHHCVPAAAPTSVIHRPYSNSKRSIAGLASYSAAVAPSRDCPTAGVPPCSVSQDAHQQQQQQPRTAAERHRALVADADAALARLAACRAAAMAGASAAHAAAGGNAVPDGRQAEGITVGAAGRLRAGSARTCSTAEAGDAVWLPGPAVQERSCLGYRIDRTAMKVTNSPATRTIGFDSMALSAAAARKGDKPFVEDILSRKGRADSQSAPQLNGVRLQELQEELAALDHDFTDAEAQLQAAAARLSGYTAAC